MDWNISAYRWVSTLLPNFKIMGPILVNRISMASVYKAKISDPRKPFVNVILWRGIWYLPAWLGDCAEAWEALKLSRGLIVLFLLGAWLTGGRLGTKGLATGKLDPWAFEGKPRARTMREILIWFYNENGFLVEKIQSKTLQLRHSSQWWFDASQDLKFVKYFWHLAQRHALHFCMPS